MLLATTWLILTAPALGADAASGDAGVSAVEATLVSELDRALGVLGTQPEKPHYISLAVTDQTTWRVSATEGTLANRDEDRTRTLDVDLRVGDPSLDSTRPLRGFSSLEGSSRGRIRLPADPGTEDALRHAVWRELDKQYRDNAQRIVMIRAERTVKVEEEVQADDFEPRTPVVARQTVRAVAVDLDAWGEILVELSERLDGSDIVNESDASLNVGRVTKTFVDTEGTRLVHGTTHARLSLSAQTVADDGDVVTVFRAFDVHDPASLPGAEVLDAWVGEATTHLASLRDAPRGTPYSGPVLLEGKATAVFFHEVFGHRVEGHRQKREYEGRTFAAKVGEPILPPFIDVYDDPTLATWGENDLNGHYAFDDEGVPAARATLVEDGRFAGFLMGRSPLPDTAGSNGHGRRQSGNAPVSRMGNTIVEASRTVSADQLRDKLRAEVRAQGLPYGYVVTDIDGGFTMTGRITPNAFNVRANTTYRVYADGRPDELVRGIDLVGTPLVAFRNIVAASDVTDVFNGHCGAESGWVPVSAVAPGILVRRLEFQLKEKGQERPPLLKKPVASGDGTSDADEGGAR